MTLCGLNGIRANDCPINASTSEAIQEYNEGAKSTRALQKYIASQVNMHRKAASVLGKFSTKEYCPSKMRCSLVKSSTAAKRTATVLAKLRSNTSFERMTRSEYRKIMSRVRMESGKGRELWSRSLSDIWK